MRSLILKELTFHRKINIGEVNRKKLWNELKTSKIGIY